MSKNTQSTSTQSELEKTLDRFVAEVKSQLDFAKKKQVEALVDWEDSRASGNVAKVARHTRETHAFGGQVVALDWVLWELRRLDIGQGRDLPEAKEMSNDPYSS